MNDKPTLDTNIMIYGFGENGDIRKQIAKEVIAKCNIISLQVVNETVYVLLKKFKFHLSDVDPVIHFLKQKFIISELNMHILDLTVNISAKYGFSFLGQHDGRCGS